MSRPVIFLQPPASYDNPNPCLDDKQFGLGILANAAWLKSKGFLVEGHHIPLTRHYGNSVDACLDAVIARDPLLVAIGLNWVHFSEGAIETARRLKARNPDLPIVIGGQHASLFASEIAEKHHECIDGVIQGEAEVPLLTICRALLDTGVFPVNVPGLHRPGHPTPRPIVVGDMGSLPSYSYRTFQTAPLQRDVGAISTTRGACPFKCAWCIEPVIGRMQGRKKIQFHSAAHIADQMQSLLDEGIDRFTIQDNFFVGGDRKLVELTEELARRNLRPKHLNIFSHPESFGGEGFAAFATVSDMASLDFGVETGSVKVAKINYRRLDPDQVVQQTALAVNSGVEVYTWWMVGLPGEDDTALAETEDLILRTMEVGGVPRWVSPLILFPKTPIHEAPEAFGVTTRFKNFEDYTTFSRTTLAEAVLFSDTIGHETNEASREDITKASLRLRKFIASKLDRLRAFYANRPVSPDLSAVESRVLQSFF